LIDVIFLGTNGWYDTDTGNTVSVLVKCDRYNIVFDAGNGFHKLDEYVDQDHETFLFLSHFHLDHISGLHILNKMKRVKALKIFGPSGAKDVLETLVNTPFTMPLKQLSFVVEICELPLDKAQVPFHLDYKPLNHTSLTLGYRLEEAGRTIAYCPDTGYCENAVSLSRNADLVIAECAYKSGAGNPDWPHLNPETAARIAKEAGARMLALVHFDASIYRTITERKEAEKQAQRVFGNTFAAEDDMRIKI
jgi:ribonuclease BN (tRNA processing enzyme)